MVSILGVNMRFIHIGTFVLGAFLAGAAGVIAGPLYTVYPDMGHQMLVISFVVLVIGGVGSLRGTVPAAFLVGFVQSLCEFFITELAMVIVFLTMAVVLAFMPRGLLREGRFE
jgi:branched-chain amino acid transport system permease protein